MPTPLAAGTIGQVHRAALATGERVVVKVQRPEARTLITQDLALLKLGTEAVGSSDAVQRRIDLPAVFDHLSTSLHQELDFNREAANAERLRATLADFPRLAVPAIHPGYSTSRLLVMQDVAGAGLADVPAHLRQETARQFLESFYKQILIDGFFHADPHPGNLMWQPDEERLYFLDLGMVGVVGRRDARAAGAAVDGVLAGGCGALDRRHSHAVALDRSQRPRRHRPSPTTCSSSWAECAESAIKDIQLGHVLQEMLDIAFRHGVPVPASLALTVKALAQMQAAAAELDPNVDPFEVAGRFITRSTMKNVLAKADPKMLFYEAQKLRFRAARLLEALERLVGARPGEKLEVNFRGTSLEETIWRAGRQLAIGLVGGFALVASAITSASRGPSDAWSVAFGAAGMASVAALLVGIHARPAARPHAVRPSAADRSA